MWRKGWKMLRVRMSDEQNSTWCLLVNNINEFDPFMFLLLHVNENPWIPLFCFCIFLFIILAGKEQKSMYIQTTTFTFPHKISTPNRAFEQQPVPSPNSQSQK